MKKKSNKLQSAKPMLRTQLACLLAGMMPLAATAGPTFEFGEQGSLTITYALQGWMQHKSFTSPTDSGSSASRR